MSDEARPLHTWRHKGRGFVRPEGRRSFIALVSALGVFFVAAVGVAVYEGQQARRTLHGDGRNVETYGFDLSNLNISRETLVPSEMLRDEPPVLYQPNVLTLAEVDAQSDYPLWPLVHDDEPVVGVVINGEARAYPVRFLRGHEIVNDRLGGQPIVVTYSVVSDSAAVFDRRVGGQEVVFDYSGLFSNSNLVMYDRPAPRKAMLPPEESRGFGYSTGSGPRGAAADETPDPAETTLWSQLKMRAIAGAHAADSADQAERLTLLPMWYGSWGDWREREPQTTVLEPVREHRRRYTAGATERYFAGGEVAFPVDHLASATPSGDPIMTPVLVQGGEATGWEIREEPMQDADAPLRPTIYTRWFAWHAAWGE